MAKVKILLKDSLASLRQMVTTMRSENISKLMEFSRKKCLEYGIISKTSTAQVDMRINSNTARKTFKKIYTSLYNQLLKKVPFLEFREVGEITLHYSRMELEIPLASRPMSCTYEELVAAGLIRNGDPYSYIGGSEITTLLSVKELSRDVNAVKRYVRYINKKSARSACPIKITVKEGIEFKDNLSSLKTSSPVEFTRKIILIITAGYWRNTFGDSYGRVSAGETRELWDFHRFEEGRDMYSSYPGCSIFNLFTFLPELQTVMKTLSRKSSFNENAYII